LKESQIFSSSDVVLFGKRRSVDSALENLIKQSKIVRLTGGVFLRGDNTTPRPPAVAVVREKARVFGWQLLEDKDDPNFSGIPSNDKNEVTFYITGNSTSFMYGQTKVILKSISPRKLRARKTQQALEHAFTIPQKNAELLKQFRDFLSQPDRVR